MLVNDKTRVIFEDLDTAMICRIQHSGTVTGETVWYDSFVGEAKRRPGDQVNRPLARELSLTRAVKTLSRRARGEILSVFYKRRRRPEHPVWAQLLLARERALWDDQ